MSRRGNSRQKMIEVALDLFHQKGVVATSIDDILEKSRTGKSQFYHYFKSKEGLVHEVLQYFYNLVKSNQLPYDSNIETWEDLEKWFKGFIDFEKAVRYEKGCPIATIGNDVTNDQELLRQDIKLIFEFNRHCLAKFFASMKARGELPKLSDPEALADLCFSIQQGGLIISKVERDHTTFERSVTQILNLIKSLRV